MARALEDAQDEVAYAHEFGAANTLLLVGLLMLCMAAGYVLQERKAKYLPESGAAMLLGTVAGGIIRLTVKSEAELDFLQFNALIFFFVLLPPIIFEAGYTLKKKRFFSNITAISLYAVVGTFVSTFVVGFLTFGFAKIGLIGIDSSSPLQALLFGSLISSVDPVATLAILGSSEANCEPLLYSLVFGESVLNDAVAIVLFHVMNSYAAENKTFQSSDILMVMIRFCLMTMASVLIGVAFGLICSLVFKVSNLNKYHAYEIQLIFLFSFGCFAFAELVSMSGVTSLFFCALTLAHYNYYNLSVQTQISSKYVFEGMAKASETVVFAYMGVSIFTSRSTWSPIFIILGTGFCVLGRACNIFPMSWLANLCRTEKINSRMQTFMFFSGLRGAVSYALSQQLDRSTGHAYGIEIIQSTTLGIIIFTTFFLGGTTSHVLEKLELKNDRGRAGSNQLREDFVAYHEVSRSPSSGGDADTELLDEPAMIRVRKRVHSFWRSFDNNYMKPWFGGKGHQKSRISPALYHAIQEGNADALLLGVSAGEESGNGQAVSPSDANVGEGSASSLSEVRRVAIGSAEGHHRSMDGEDSEAVANPFAAVRSKSSESGSLELNQMPQPVRPRSASPTTRSFAEIHVTRTNYVPPDV